MRAPCLVVAAALAATGCPSPDPTQGIVTTPLDQQLDYNQFVCSAMPVLVRRCSYLACHGNPNHAFRVYSPGKLRMTSDGTRATRDQGLTQAEVDYNFESAVGMVVAASPAQRNPPDITRIPLLGKPLARRAGGAEHHGVAVFPVYPAQRPEDDQEWQLLVAWVAGAAQPNPVDATCMDVFTNIGIMPRKP